MRTCFAFALSALKPGDCLPTPLYVNPHERGPERIWEAGVPIDAVQLKEWSLQGACVLAPGHMRLAVAAYFQSLTSPPSPSLLSIAIAARLVELAREPAQPGVFKSLRANAEQIQSLSAKELRLLSEAESLNYAPFWVRQTVLIVIFLSTLAQMNSLSDVDRSALVFTGFLHGIDQRLTHELTGSLSYDPSITMTILARHFPVMPLVREALLSFDERQDGTGKPYGLSAVGIPFSAACLGLASLLGYQDASTATTLDRSIDFLNENKAELVKKFPPALVSHIEHFWL